MTLGLLTLLGLCGAGAACWLTYFRWKDAHQPEPLGLQVALIGGGALAVASAALGYQLVAEIWGEVRWEQLSGTWPEAISAALLIGATEELAKLLPVLPIVLFSAHFDEVWDGPIYAAAAAIGFALTETVALWATGGASLLESLPRVAASPITHALFAAPWGLGLGLSRVRGRHGFVLLGLFVSIACHGAYDLFLAREGLRVISVGIIAGLWIWLIWVGRNLLRRASEGPSGWKEEATRR